MESVAFAESFNTPSFLFRAPEKETTIGHDRKQLTPIMWAIGLLN